MTTKPKWTQWGKLLLIENPTNPVTQGFEGPVCDKVPRVINLRGKSTYIGRGKKSPAGGVPQVTIDLGYISSGHCCLFLREKEGGGIEAVVKDTSSNGTYVDAIRVPKGTTKILKAGDQVALYYPQGAAALGRPILYTLELREAAFEKAISENIPVSSGKVKRTKSTESSNGSGGGNSLPSPKAGSPKKMTPPAPAKRAASATPPLSPSPAPKGTTARVLKAAAKPETIVVTDGPVSPAPGGNEWLDNQVKMRQEAVAKAAKEWEGERDRMVLEARGLRSKLEASVSQNRQLFTDKNTLQEKLAEAESTRRREEEQAQQQRDQLKKAEMSLAEAEASKSEAAAGALRDRSRAAALERSEAQAKKEFERKEGELRGQIEGLIERQQLDQQKLAEVAAESKSWSLRYEQGQVEVAETQAKLSTLTAQLKDAQETAESSRAKLVEEEAASAEAKRARAEAEGELARNKNKLEAAEAARDSLQGCADEAKRLAAELVDRESTSSRASKGLEQALSDLEEERRARQRVAEELSKLEDDAAALRSEEKRVKKLLEEAVASGGAAKNDAGRLAAELEESQKGNRALRAELMQAKLDLEVSKNRRDAVKGEAQFIGTNLKKARAKAAAAQKELGELIHCLEIPTGTIMMDSQSPASFADALVDDATPIGPGSPDPNGSARTQGHGLSHENDGSQKEGNSPAPSLGNDMDEGERWDATQVSPAATGGGGGDGVRGAHGVGGGGRGGSGGGGAEERSGVGGEGGIEPGGAASPAVGAGHDGSQQGENEDLTDEDVGEAGVTNTQEDDEDGGEEEAEEQKENGEEAAEGLEDEGSAEIDGAADSKDDSGGEEGEASKNEEEGRRLMGFERSASGRHQNSGSSGSDASTFSRPPPQPPAQPPGPEEEPILSGPAAAAPHDLMRLETGLGNGDGEEEEDEDGETDFTVPPLDFGRGTRDTVSSGPRAAGGMSEAAAAGEDKAGAEADTELLSVAEMERRMNGIGDVLSPVSGEAENSRKRSRDEGEPDTGEPPPPPSRGEGGAPADKRVRLLGGVGAGASEDPQASAEMPVSEKGGAPGDNDEDEEEEGDDDRQQQENGARRRSYPVDDLANIAAEQHMPSPSFAAPDGAGAAGDGGSNDGAFGEDGNGGVVDGGEEEPLLNEGEGEGDGVPESEQRRKKARGGGLEGSGGGGEVGGEEGMDDVWEEDSDVDGEATGVAREEVEEDTDETSDERY